MRLIRLSSPTRRLMVAVIFATMAFSITVALTAAPPPSAPASPELRQAPVSVPVEATDEQWEELKARAREDVEYFETFYRARQSESRSAEIKLATSVAYKTNIDRQKQKGYTSAYTANQADIGLAESESLLDLRRVELKNAEIRLARARRRLKAVEKSKSLNILDPLSATEDRFRDLEIKYEFLRHQLEQMKRLDGKS